MGKAGTAGTAGTKASASDPVRIAQDLRTYQEADAELGPLFQRMYKFSDRTIEEFFQDTPSLPKPVLSFDKDHKDRRGHYSQMDGYRLVHKINLNPFVLATAEEAAEVLAHELVHLWQAHVGRPIMRNYHGTEFHLRMRQYGIETEGKEGRHLRYIDVTWPNWLVENEDLELDKFILPGANKEKGRQLIKHECPGCGTSFRSRKELAVQCLECDAQFEIV